MNTFLKTSLAAAISLPLLAGCVTPGEDDPNALTKQGAAGGALLGLTLGALTGDAELAMKGAVAGGVAGGVTGASADIQNNREGIRSESRDQAIANIANGNNDSSQTQNWEQLDNFVGNWNVNIQNHHQELSGVEPINAEGKLARTTQADVTLVNDQGINFTAEFSFTPEAGYQLNLVNNAKSVAVNFAGEFQPQANRYNFYPTNVSDVIYEGVNSADIHVELGFAGHNIWTIDSYAFIDGQQTNLQTFRFTRT
ncbi:hypothetical protein [Vibrio coralliilyticus]|uniref:hypothetical protein n=1 Tax=Vibrio coralliilyticus TaxID=190893 RepID=UPI001E48DB78|nr:hypothetical protein [Vibrio coralliilyticus]MCC2521169.1 hypothetical protein [Vibrio coralliilyticus]